MNITEYLKTTKFHIGNFLDDFIGEQSRNMGLVGEIGSEAAGKLLDFAQKGKMIRGGLVSLGRLVGGGGSEEAAYATGAAMELIQSGLLIHDDIMDRDLTRRGFPSVFNQYVDKANNDGLEDTYHLGEALGICVGDIAYFMAFEVLASLQAKPELCKRVAMMTASELSLVGSAQMMDMYWSAGSGPRPQDEVYRLYLYKTGRYTFSLPLAAGAVLGEADDRTISLLMKIGESLGIVFQIRDDELGLFGSENDIGKPVGSDVRESKKTIFYGLLAERSRGAEKDRLSEIFGNKDATDEDIRFVQELIEHTGIGGEVETRVGELNMGITAWIDELNAGAEVKNLITDLQHYNTARKT